MGCSDTGAIVVMGASTGGVEALEVVLRNWPQDGPPIVVVQHMPANMLEHYVDRLARTVASNVGLTYSGQRIEPGHIYFAPGGAYHLKLSETNGLLRSELVPGGPVSGHRPSVDVLFASAQDLSKGVVAVLLTGMGRDGARGMAALKEQGRWTIAQDKESSVVFGMPGAAVALDAVCELLPITEVAQGTLTAARRFAISKCNSTKRSFAR